jgi:hypothetical protein
MPLITRKKSREMLKLVAITATIALFISFFSCSNSFDYNNKGFEVKMGIEGNW